MKNKKTKTILICCIIIGVLALIAGLISIVYVQTKTKRILSDDAASTASSSTISSSKTSETSDTSKIISDLDPAAKLTPTADPNLIVTSEPTVDSASETVPVPAAETTPDPVPTSEPVPEPPAVSGNGHIVAVDAGHQSQGNSDQEPIGPGSSETKAKVASGTTGWTTGVPEYQLNLDVSLKLRDELLNRGYQVIMIRETNDVNISNAERAEIANNSGAEIFIRVHANGSDDTSVSGALTMAPSSTNPYVGDIAASCQRLSECVINSYCAATGFTNLGVQNPDNMSGINWCRIPVTIMEMGFMTNPNDDTSMQDQAMQYRMAAGMADGIDAYFSL